MKIISIDRTRSKMTKDFFDMDGYRLDYDGNIIGCSSENYKKPLVEQYKDIVKQFIEEDAEIQHEC